MQSEWKIRRDFHSPIIGVQVAQYQDSRYSYKTKVGGAPLW